MFAETVAVTPGSTMTLAYAQVDSAQIEVVGLELNGAQPEPLHVIVGTGVRAAREDKCVVVGGGDAAGVIRVVAQQVGGPAAGPHNGRK